MSLPTPRSRSRRAAGGDPPQISRDAADRYAPFPLTEVQRAYWLGRDDAFALGGFGTHLYWELEAIELDVPRLEAAWNRLVQRHDMLRAIVLPSGEQQVLEHVGRYVIATSVTGSGRNAVQDTLAARREAMSHQVFAVDTWPLFDIRVTPRGGGISRIHLSFDCIPLDGWSLSVLLAEWSRCYLDADAPLPPIGIEFRDCVLGASQEPESLEAARAYWMDRLADMHKGPALPIVRDPSTLQRPRFRRREARLSQGSYARLKAAAARAKVTVSAFLLTAYCEVLTRFSRDARFTLNLTLFDRPALHPDVERVVGDFTSLLLFSVGRSPGASPAASFGQRAAALQDQLWRDLDHRAYHGLEVMRELARRTREGGVAVPVVFTSALVASGFELGALGKLGFGLTQTPQVWLDHQIYEVSTDLALVWDAVEELFPDGLLDSMFSYYERTVRALIADDPTSVPVLSRAELERRRSANATRRALPPGLLSDTLTSGLGHGPSRPAVITPSRVMTYGELDAESNRIGRLLRSRGARPGKLVAVVMRKGWEQVAAVLGILKAGGAYLPVDADLPAERVTYLLDNGEIEQVLTTQDVATSVTWPEGVAVFSVDVPRVWAGVTDEPLDPAQTPQDLAYVIYTSGSTGQPKGVMISHQAALNTIADVNARLAAGPDDRVLSLSSLSFDLSVYDLFGMLACGGALVLPPSAAAREPRAWLDLMIGHRVTLWNSVPALMEMLVESIGAHETLGGLRHVLLSGDWIPVSLPDRVREVWPRAEVTSLGGATEASIWSILYAIGEVSPAWNSVPYGRAMANQTFHVLDEHLDDRPDWVPGELYIGGAGLAQGYWRDPELSSRKFITHPRTGVRLYRTGDWGRYLPEGVIEFLGRVDAQVKIRGYRIECGEIEAGLLRHPWVRQCAVVAQRDASNHPHLVAYVVWHDHAGGGEGNEVNGRSEHPPDVRALRELLATKVPGYMVPSSFVVLPALPLTQNGKVDTAALSLARGFEPEAAGPRLPQSETEATILEIVARELGKDHIGIEDNFFEIGGDSIHALRILHAIARVFETELAMVRLLEDPTIAGLAMAVEDAVIGEIEAREQ